MCDYVYWNGFQTENYECYINIFYNYSFKNGTEKKGKPIFFSLNLAQLSEMLVEKCKIIKPIIQNINTIYYIYNTNNNSIDVCVYYYKIEKCQS